MRRSRAIAAGAATVLALTSGYAALDVYDKVPGILTLATPAEQRVTGPAQGSAQGPAQAAATGGSSTTTSSTPPTAGAVPPLGALSTTAPVPSRAGIAAQLAGPLRDARLGGSVGVAVRDAATRSELYGRGDGTPRTPASTTKLLTATAALHVLGPSATAVTRVVAGATSHGVPTVVLVAGGDSLMATGKGDPRKVAGRAGMGDLAAQVATALRSSRQRSVRVALDDHVANGPATAPHWLKDDVNEGFAGPVAMLGLASRRTGTGRPGPADPAMVATRAFASALRAAGVTVVGSPTRARASAAARPLGSVSSAPVADVLASALVASDNTLTETVARRAAARAGAGTTFPQVAAFVLRTVGSLGIDTSGVRLVDSCGLSHGTAIPPRVLSAVLDLAAGGRDPGLQQVVSQLPVAGLTGTLHSRFHAASTRGAAGIARGKTGTLTGVSALAGTVVDRDGRLLTYAVMADRVPARTGSPGARAAIDRVVAALAGCGCGS